MTSKISCTFSVGDLHGRFTISDEQDKYITSFRCRTMLCEIDNIVQKIPSLKRNTRNIPQNIVSRIEQCYGYEQC